MKKNNGLRNVAWWLIIIGALNWLLVGLQSFGGVDYGWDVIKAIFNGWAPAIAAILYLLIGLSALYLIFDQK